MPRTSPDSFPPAVRHLREAAPSLSPFLATTLALLSEVARGSGQQVASTGEGAGAAGGTQWGPYLATLPDGCPDCLLNWTAEEKKELEGTALEEQGPEPAADVFRRHAAPLLAERPDLWPGLQPAQQRQEAPGSTGAEGGEDAGLAAFVRAASLVQSRAFHLEAENWVSGAKEIAQLSSGGTQVFLLPGIDMINHSHNPDRRNARLERINLAQAQPLLDEAAAAGEGGEAATRPAEAYFVMRADKPIPAGTEVLHTYGDLSDAQLLQTYGFLDSEDDFRQQHPGGEEAAAGSGGGCYRNPHNAALVPWAAVEGVCSGLLRSMDQAPPAAVKKAKREFLASAGVLQPAAPADTQFVLLAREPLPGELLTAVQVLLMTKEEFQELRREFGGGAAAAAGGQPAGSPGAGRAKKVSKGSGVAKDAEPAPAPGAAGSGSGAAPAAPAPKLALGTSLLEEDEDFAEMVCIACLQILESCLERYPGSAKDDVRLLRSAECTGRKRLAVRVRVGERDVLHLAKKAVVELMRKLRDGEAGDKDDGEGDEDGSSASEDEEQGIEEKAQAGSAGKRGAAASGAAPAGQRSAKRRRRGLGAQASEGAEDEAGGDGGEEQDDDGLLMGSDDSQGVGYGAEDYDDGIGEAHDRGGAHPAPKD
ncbi:hypothetical protein GPECTOR_2g1024 [Gonium pectorale]|uniref:Rubisco LSMT substrate-binding domain-containing protein n=1 Tax=Gonium pectorale TaxID=33097 RepID=A0A150H074_GONPE|nr:hypothetical protein GPECTOR_2g1024 [Gonium pectorale]|eukprot:KXZ55475.1 hypothetical protein GPECTOR_2g1024 [Gonium pectorale]